MLDSIMAAWDRTIRSFLPARATDKTQVRIEGYDSDRVLILGDGAAVGWGVDSQDDALLGTLAREMSALSGRGTNADLVADPFMTAERAVSLAQDLLVWRYDFVFVLLGFSDTSKLTSTATWRREMANLLAYFTDELAVSAQIVVASIPSTATIKQVTWPFSTIITRRAEALNEQTVDLCSGRPRVRYVEIAGANPSAMKNSYAMLASQLAGAVARVVNDDDEHPEAVLHLPNVEESSPLSVPAEENLWRVPSLVRLAFQVEHPSVTVLDGERQWGINSSRTALVESDDSTIPGVGAENLIVVGDTQKDRRFRAAFRANGDRRIRFYASFPIESPLGELVGNLCITDPTPRRRNQEVDVSSFRRLAQIAQRELWRYLPPQFEPRTSPAGGDSDA